MSSGRRARRGDPRSRQDLTVLARGGILNLVGVLTQTIFSFGLIIIVTRGLGDTSAGIFLESIALFHIAMTLAQWGADVGAVRLIPRSRALGRSEELRPTIRAAIVPAVILGVVVALLLLRFAAPLGSLLTNGEYGSELSPVIRVLAPFVPLAAGYTVALAITRAFGTMLPTTVIDRIGRAMMQPIFVAVVLAAGLSGPALSLAWVLPFALGSVACAIWVRHLVREAEAGWGSVDEPTVVGRVFREFWRFSAPRGLASMFAVIVLWLDTLLIGAMRAPAEAGTYAAATRYLVFGQFIGVAIANVLGPKLSEVLASNDRERARSMYATATWWLMALAWPVYLTMIVLAPALLSVFGSGYADADGVLMILGATMLVATFVGPVDIVLLMAGKSSWNLLNTAIAVVVNIGLNIALIPEFGILGAAVAWSASILLNNLLPLVQVWRVVDLHPFGVGSLIVGLGAVAVFGAAGLLARALLGDQVQAVVLAGCLATPPYLWLLWRARGPLHLTVVRDALRSRRASRGESDDTVEMLAR